MPVATVEINRLKIYAYHGVFGQETAVGNDFELTVHLEYPCAGAMQTDELEATISYADVITLIEKEMKKPSRLLENVVYRIYTSIVAAYPKVCGGYITLLKLHPPLSGQMESCGFTYRW
ncbi:MAG: dihydroneopterin aldolase [Muribaculaceae bacterium]|nr:dihydroneopterin aldolase [Muribaculaceae bacterium]MDE6331420.1 dihydroneopterin aldolase [Muribaculaceae bacterium]